MGACAPSPTNPASAPARGARGRWAGAALPRDLDEDLLELRLLDPGAQDLPRDGEGRALGKHRAAMDENHAVAEVLNLRHVVGRVQDAEARVRPQVFEEGASPVGG